MNGTISDMVHPCVDEGHIVTQGRLYFFFKNVLGVVVEWRELPRNIQGVVHMLHVRRARIEREGAFMALAFRHSLPALPLRVKPPAPFPKTLGFFQTDFRAGSVGMFHATCHF